MALWIRIDEAYRNDPALWQMSGALSRPYPEILGYVLMLSLHMARWCPDGRIGSFPDAELERWCAWDGERGQLAGALRGSLVLPDGMLLGWSDRMGKLLEWQAKNSDRKRKSPGRSRGNSVIVSRNSSNDNGESRGVSPGNQRDEEPVTEFTTNWRAILEKTLESPS